MYSIVLLFCYTLSIFRGGIQLNKEKEKKQANKQCENDKV